MESDADLVAATTLAGGTILLRGSEEWNRTRKIVAATAAAGGTILGKCLFEANFVISLILHIFTSQSRVFLSQT